MTSPHNPTPSIRDHQLDMVPNSPGPAQHHEYYYWDTVTFLVEDRLFKVPRYYFLESDIFRTTFSLPPENTAEGNSDESPFKLEGIKKDEFWSFLRVIYPPFQTELHLSPAEWLAVLKLSFMWNFPAVQEHAIERLSVARIEPIEQVILARTHKIRSWLIVGYVELVARDDPIDIAEGKKLGVEATVTLFRAREKVSSSNIPSHNLTTFVTDIITTVFQEELEELGDNVAEFVVALENYEMKSVPGSEVSWGEQ